MHSKIALALGEIKHELSTFQKFREGRQISLSGDHKYIHSNASTSTSHTRICLPTELEKRPQPQLPRSSEELEDLQKLLHFPEEVALRLAESEYQLFYQVPPSEFLRHVSQDLNASQQREQQRQQREQQQREQQATGGGGGIGGDASSGPSLTSSSTQTEDEASWPTCTASVSVQTLINRFTEVRAPLFLAFQSYGGA